jgi:hypothetical protein
MFTKEMDRCGKTRELVRLNIDGAMASQMGISLEQLQSLANKCFSHEWLCQPAIGAGSQYDFVCLTELGDDKVRVWQHEQSSLRARPFPKKLSLFITEHSGLLSLASLVISIIALLRKG